MQPPFIRTAHTQDLVLELDVRDHALDERLRAVEVRVLQGIGEDEDDARERDRGVAACGDEETGDNCVGGRGEERAECLCGA